MGLGRAVVYAGLGAPGGVDCSAVGELLKVDDFSVGQLKDHDPVTVDFAAGFFVRAVVVAEDDDGVALCDELAGFEGLEGDVFAEDLKNSPT